jgi:gamma-F420-2:alpha-L-glutamate ligase
MKILELNCANGDSRLQSEMESVVLRESHEYHRMHVKDVVLVCTDGVLRVFHFGQEIGTHFDVAFVRGRGKYAHMTSLLVRVLKHQQTKIHGSLSAGEFTHNDGKITQMVDLTLAQLPIPKTIIFAKGTFATIPAIFESAGFTMPAVLKRTGSKGSCVWKVNSYDDISKQLEMVDAGELFLLQEYIPNSFDIRALYFGGQFIGAMARKSNDGFYNNASLGADVEKIEITKDEHELALRACAVLNQDFAGVDIVRSDRGPLFFEINNRPGYEGFERATGISVGARVAEIMLKHM